MKTQDIVIIALIIIVIFLLTRNVSGYAATSSLADRQAAFASNLSGTWMDIDTTQTSTWTASTLVPGGTSNGVNLNNVALANLNWMMWTGSNVVTVQSASVSTQVTISLPSGVTTANVQGLRKKITTGANGNPIGTDVYFLTTDPLTRMTRTCQVGATWASEDATIGRVSLPDYVILKKSLQDPRAPVDCTYTATQATPACSSPCGGLAGNVKYNISNFSPALYQGACPNSHGATVTGDGTVTSTESCTSAACSFASLYAVGAFLDVASAPVPCSYTPSNAGCSATPCGTSGVTQYTISGFTAAQNGGACPPLFGTPVTVSGQVVNSTSPCSAPACSPATAITSCPTIWEEVIGGVCVSRKFLLSQVGGGPTLYLGWGTAGATANPASASIVTPTNYFKYNPTAKILYAYNADGTLAGYGTCSAATFVASSKLNFPNTPPPQTWTVAPDQTLANSFSFKNDTTGNYISSIFSGNYLSSTTSTATRWIPIFI